MISTTTGRMSLEDYLAYEDGAGVRYELVQGELLAMTPPTWLHIAITKFLERVFDREIERSGLPWEAFREPGQQTEESSARLPDVAVVPTAWVTGALDQSAILTVAAILVVEVVSESTATQDYREKVKEYQETGIGEYWVVDPDPFGAAKYVGSPKLPTVSLYALVDGVYEVQRFQGNEAIVSRVFPELRLTVNEVLRAGR